MIFFEDCILMIQNEEILEEVDNDDEVQIV